jgi:hypothetical protein
MGFLSGLLGGGAGAGAAGAGAGAGAAGTGLASAAPAAAGLGAASALAPGGSYGVLASDVGPPPGALTAPGGPLTIPELTGTQAGGMEWQTPYAYPSGYGAGAGGFPAPLGTPAEAAGGGAPGGPSPFWKSPFGRYLTARTGFGPPTAAGGGGGGFDSPTGPAPDDRPALPAGSQLLYPGGTPETSIPIGGAPWPTGQPAPQPSGFWQSPFGRFVQARYGVGPRRGAGGGDDLDQILTYLLRQGGGPPARTLPVTGGLPGNNQFYW